MAVVKRYIDYFDGDQVLQGMMAWDDDVTGARPGVLVSHAWSGRSSFEEGKAEKLAALGFRGFALDLYGKGVLGTSMAENAALMQPLLDDREMLQRRMLLARDVMRKQAEVDSQHLAAIGFCFGGLCVLDLARTGADIAGVASFHGLFHPPGNTEGNAIRAKVLVMHGWDDPMATPAQAIALASELSAAGANWQLHAYGGTSHAFTNPDASDAANGLMYRADADRRSWQALQNFLAELFP
jgi:dienelactone hydrolase